MSNPNPAERKAIFKMTLYEQKAASRAVECHLIRQAVERAMQEFGGGVGGKLSGTIEGPHDLTTGVRPVLGFYQYMPSAAP
jgi:hypothetical protein